MISPDPDGSGLPLLRRAQRITYAGTGLVEQVEQGTVTGTSDSAWALFIALQSVHLTYDSNRRVVRQGLGAANAFQAVRDLQYDAFNRVECAATRMNQALFGTLTAGCTLQSTGSDGPDRIQRTLYTLAGQVHQQQTAYGTSDAAVVSTSSYTSNGQLATITDANGNVTTYTHDGHGRLFRTCYPGSTSCTGSNPGDYEQLSYEDTGAGSSLRTSGLIASRRLRDGRSIGYTHDALGRLTFKDVPAGGYWDGDITYAYDLLGRRLSASSSQGGTGTDSLWSWDALGRMTAEDSGFGWNLLSYDLAGRLTRHTFTDGFYVDYDHLVTGEVTRVRENGSTTSSCDNQANCVLATFAYDDLGRRTSLTRGNGTSASYAYNPAAQLSQLAESIPGTSYGQTLDFLYNRAAQITQRDSNNTNYSYTARVNGTVADTINGLNQIDQTGATTVTHDANGNTSAIGAASYGYTSENRLATAPNGIYLPYWASGNLWEVYESPSAVTMFEYVGGNMISERDNTGTLTHRYVRGPGVDEVLVDYLCTTSCARRFLHADERGSIVALTNDIGTTGGIIAVNSYDEYGVPAAGNVGRFQYTGQPWIAQIGMYYYRARFYNPRLGRFMQTDPIGYSAGMNLYGYVGGDPVNLSDPSGLAGSEACITTGSLICRPRDGNLCGTCTGWTDAGPMADPGPGPTSGNMSGGATFSSEGARLAFAKTAAMHIVKGLYQAAQSTLQDCTSAACRGDLTAATRAIVFGMLDDPDVRDAMIMVWALSVSRHQPHRERSMHEHGIFVRQVPGDYIASGIIHGRGATFDYIPPTPQGFSIFYHSHPFSLPYRAWLSPEDRSWADGRGLMIVAMSRRNFWAYDSR